MVGTAGGTSFGCDKSGRPILTKELKLLLNDDNAGKPEGIHLMIGQRPYAAVGNPIGDRLAMLVQHARQPGPGPPGRQIGIVTCLQLTPGPLMFATSQPSFRA